MPHPDGPTRATNSPGATTWSNEAMAVTSPKRTEIPVNPMIDATPIPPLPAWPLANVDPSLASVPC